MEDQRQEVGEERKAFVENRASGVGATDSPKILGLSRWGTALTVYNDKKGLTPDRGESLPAWLGTKLQATVAELYTAATGVRLRADNRHHRHVSKPWLVCHLDYRAWGRPDILVEIKTRASMDGWGPEVPEGEAPEIPPDVWVQVQHEMTVTGASAAHVAVLFGHHTYRTYAITRDDIFIGTMLPRLEDFWVNNVLADIPPEPTGSPADTEAVKQTWDVDHDDMVMAATPEQNALISKYAMARYNVLQAKLGEEAVENRLRTIIGPHAGIAGAAGTVTWKRTRPSKSVGWEEVAAAHRAQFDTALGALVKAGVKIDHPFQDPDAIQSLYTTTEPGVRRVYFKEST